eukprot:TRINITY_DN1583_c0_g2_i1.p1 TRINITY_DN1583_c0_g2~~TRINITY_DN1583_c0_g2_i1.p1  ORF type:complete len:499 (+),score=64.39 TRINITY_DN1583_c0_g2_i1:123-1619(+)
MEEGVLPKELCAKVGNLQQAISELSDFLETQSMDCYFQNLLIQLAKLSKDVDTRLSEVSTFYSFLSTHQVASSSTTSGYFSLLPDELLLKVLSFLSETELSAVASVNQQWKRLAEDQLLWKRLYFLRWRDKHFGDHRKMASSPLVLPLKPGHQQPHPQPQPEEQQIIATTDVEVNGAEEGPVPQHEVKKIVNNHKTWKRHYIRRHKIESNWKEGRFKVKTFPGSRAHTRVRCLQFDDEKLVMGSFDKKSVRVLDFHTRKSLAELSGHTGGVMSLKFKKSILLSASRDKTVKMWDINNSSCVSTFTEHMASVWCLDWDGGSLAVSGSEDRLVKMWDLRTGDCVQSFSGHAKGIGSITFDEHYIGSGSRDKTVRMWDTRMQRCLHTLRGHTNSVRCLKFDDRRVVSGSWDNTIKIWDLVSGERIGKDLNGHIDRVLTLQFDDFKIVSGSFDQKIKIWSLHTGACLHTLDGHECALAHVQFDESKVVSGARDLTIKVWDFG